MTGPDPFATPSRWSRTLDLFSVLALGVAVFGAYQAFSEGVGPGVTAGALCVVAVGLWMRVRRGQGRWPPYALVIISAGLLVVPGSGLAGGFHLTVTIALLGLREGFRNALLANLGAALTVTLWYALRDGETLEYSVISGAGIVLFLMLGVGFGALLRELALAREVAGRHGAELAVANEQLRASIATERELVLAHERARSARDLHDGLGHRLTLVAMSLDFAQRMRTRDPDSAWREITSAATTNLEALDHMRLWVRALDPPASAASVGGPAAFAAIADAFRGTGLAVRVAHQGSVEALPGPVAVFATRFIQEGLTNVLRHAQADEVDITIVQSPHQVRIEVRDNGVERAAGGPEGFGLRSLRTRAEELGGRLTSGPSGAGGWELDTVLPLEERSTARAG